MPADNSLPENPESELTEERLWRLRQNFSPCNGFLFEILPRLSPRAMERLRKIAFFSPPAIWLLYVCAAFLIGNEYSCKGGFDFYFYFGLITLPILFACPFLSFQKLHWALCSLFAIAFSVIGIVVWVWAFDASDMYFMCRLF